MIESEPGGDLTDDLDYYVEQALEVIREEDAKRKLKYITFREKVKQEQTKKLIRRLTLLLILVVAFISGWGWTKMVLAMNRIERHERALAMQAGGIINHEKRLLDLEGIYNAPDPEVPDKRPTLADLMCARASKTKVRSTY